MVAKKASINKKARLYGRAFWCYVATKQQKNIGKEVLEINTIVKCELRGGDTTDLCQPVLTEEDLGSLV